MDYEAFRQFADSWGLVYLCIISLAALFFVFKPGASRSAKEASQIPFHDDEPAAKD